MATLSIAYFSYTVQCILLVCLIITAIAVILRISFTASPVFTYIEDAVIIIALLCLFAIVLSKFFTTYKTHKLGIISITSITPITPTTYGTIEPITNNPTLNISSSTVITIGAT